MATVPVFNEAGLLSLLGDELYFDYFATEEGGAGDSNKGADGSSDATTSVEEYALESLVDLNKGATEAVTLPRPQKNAYWNHWSITFY